MAYPFGLFFYKRCQKGILWYQWKKFTCRFIRLIITCWSMTSIGKANTCIQNGSWNVQSPNIFDFLVTPFALRKKIIIWLFNDCFLSFLQSCYSMYIHSASEKKSTSRLHIHIKLQNALWIPIMMNVKKEINVSQNWYIIS